MDPHQQLDRVFHALSDPTRRAILKRVALGDRTVGELAEPFAMSLAAVSKHLQVLHDAGLLDKQRVGRTSVCSLRLAPLAEASREIRELGAFWEERLDELEAYLQRRREKQGDG